VPVVGDEVLVSGWSLQVTAMDGRRVDRLRLTPLPEEPGGDEAGAHDAPGGGER
jgi:CBS domain containing-hemolysin-like protein